MARRGCFLARRVDLSAAVSGLPRVRSRLTQVRAGPLARRARAAFGAIRTVREWIVDMP